MPAGHWMGLATCFIIFYSQLFCFHRHTACWLVGQCFKCANLRVLSSAWDNKMRNSFLKVSSCSPSDCLLSQNINRWRTELFFFSCRLIHPWLSLTLIKETWHWLNRLSTPQVLTKPLCCRLHCCLSFRLRSAPLLIVKDARERRRCCVLKGRGTAEECRLRWMSA